MALMDTLIIRRESILLASGFNSPALLHKKPVAISRNSVPMQAAKLLKSMFGLSFPCFRRPRRGGAEIKNRRSFLGL